MSDLFKEGHPGGPGRPKGSKDEKWKSLQSLWDELIKLFPKLPDNKKADIYLTMIKLHAERVLAKLPNTPDDSVNNASIMLAQLKELEKGLKEFDTPGSTERHPDGLVVGKIDVQAKANSETH